MIDSKQTSNILLGVILDVSSSMQRNWNNHDSRKVPPVEIIRELLNKRIFEFQNDMHDSEKRDDTEIFCLGMGFKTFMHMNNEDISYQREHGMGPNTKRLPVHHLVCDLLALADIVPDRDKLVDLQEQLNKRWQYYAKDIMEHSTITESVGENLRSHIQQEMYQSAIRRLRRGWQYKLSQIEQQNSLPDWLAKYAQNYAVGRERKIAKVSFQDSQSYVNDVIKDTKNNFEQNASTYIHIIQNCLENFIEEYTHLTLKALTLGFGNSELVETLDAETAMVLVAQVQSELALEVKKNINLIMAKHLAHLEISKLSIGAHINNQKARNLTERCIAKHGWDIIQPLIETTIYTIFLEKFEKQIEQDFPYWIQLASMREVTRPIRQITNILPLIQTEHSTADKIMFGGTPFALALDKAAIRFIDPQYQENAKVLIIISDGEFFQSSSVVATADLLKKRGVKIISCIVANHDLRTRFIKQSPKNWPEGATQMLEIASDQDNLLLPPHIELTDEKLCIQVNHSSIINDVLSTFLN
ncbi:hypothetical protein KDA_30590 [Dictyobacter alpinus]|uniref:VWFA domain-containing protein n=1 Tax=Dictyobacter alpinus TaxID=2014873 RepID=A0A402B897_9CHLR|nr:vWA domain-containing protein [Dictyobacter alpinus]GCE27575.1 hypothetical protein KDA_30590 [Dictyobacter alpinus]